MGGQPKSKASSWSAEVGRLWEEPTEAISGKQTREAVGILAACGGEDVQLTSLLPRVSRQVIFRGSRAFLLGNSVDCEIGRASCRGRVLVLSCVVRIEI